MFRCLLSCLRRQDSASVPSSSLAVVSHALPPNDNSQPTAEFRDPPDQGRSLQKDTSSYREQNFPVLEWLELDCSVPPLCQGSKTSLVATQGQRHPQQEWAPADVYDETMPKLDGGICISSLRNIESSTIACSTSSAAGSQISLLQILANNASKSSVGESDIDLGMGSMRSLLQLLMASTAGDDSAPFSGEMDMVPRSRDSCLNIN